ncbi:MAG: LysM peptidoglycan-binding domain-containing protein [Sedimentisphaerales bacterium]
MTSDAKIGLLLGLVFIFVIAFVINGLPRFRSTTNGSELTTNMVSSYNDPLGIGDKEREVQSLIDWPEPQTPEQPAEPQTAQPASEREENIRFRIKLPEKISSPPIVEAADESTPAVADEVAPDPVKVVEQDPVEVVARTPETVSHAPAPQPASPQPVAEPKIEVKKPSPRRPVSPKVYTVADGDNLAKIAKKFYGAEEGNKRASIMRIFEANRGLLASPDEVGAGQQLLIPPPSRAETPGNASTKAQSKPDERKSGGTLTDALFETVKSVGRTVLQPDKPKDEPKPPATRQYVVQDGDYLWKIATRELGDGSRYKEIAKLNTDILDDETKLRIGTTLKLPAR